MRWEKQELYGEVEWTTNLESCVFRITSTSESEMPTADSYLPSRSDLLVVERGKPGITERGCVCECFAKISAIAALVLDDILCCFSVLCDFFRYIFLLMGQCRSFSWTSEWETYSEVSVIAVGKAFYCDTWCKIRGESLQASMNDFIFVLKTLRIFL